MSGALGQNVIKRFYAERIRRDGNQNLTTTMLYEDYCAWCEAHGLAPYALPQFAHLIGLLGVKKARLHGRVRYLGIGLVSAPEDEGAEVILSEDLFEPRPDEMQAFYDERIRPDTRGSLTARALYDEYCRWCEERQREPLVLPTFGREFGELGVRKQRIAGRVRYLGIALRSLSTPGTQLGEV